MLPITPSAPDTYDEPLATLLACHERMRRELDGLDDLRRHLPTFGCDADARVAAHNLLRYFDTAAPSHHADEESSLFPRLSHITGGDADALIGELEAQHAEIFALWRRLRPDLAAIAAGQRSMLTPDLVRRVRLTYLDHLEREERDLLPLAAARLDAGSRALMAQEMAGRRGASTRDQGSRP